MKSKDPKIVPISGEVSSLLPELPIAELVGNVYETAPPAFRISLLEELLKPLGVLSLISIAGGIVAKIRFGSGWQSMGIRFEDAQKVQAKDVVALVGRLQQVSVESLGGVAKLMADAPNLGGAAAAALALTLLLQQARNCRDSDL